MTITDQAEIDNGFDLESTLAARQAMTDNPAAAAFQWRASNEWISGTHSRTSIVDYFGAGDEQSHRRTFVHDTDHPELFAAADNDVTPVETVLVALAGCLTAGVASVATNRGIQLRSVRSTLTADMDLQGILGIDSEVRNGFSGIAVHYEIDADATVDEIRGLVAQSQKRSAVFDIITSPTNVVVDIG